MQILIAANLSYWSFIEAVNMSKLVSIPLVKIIYATFVRT